MADLRRSVNECIECDSQTAIEAVNDQDEAALRREFRRWEILDVLMMDQNRVDVVKALAERLGDGFTLLGKKWENVGLKSQGVHSGVPGANLYYASHKVSLNLFGGCVHGGMPLRPYDIASANGLIFTHYNRELPDLFEPGKECIAFSSTGEMHEQLNRVLAAPSEFDPIVAAGHRRMKEHHTWEHRMRIVLKEAGERFAMAA
jgi:spore maturation protein CgeB